MPAINDQIAEVFEAQSGRVLASLIGSIGDFNLAEDVLQEALLAAMERWPQDGVPPNAVAWLTLTARRKAIDRLRRDKTYQRKLEEMGTKSIFVEPINVSDSDDVIPDERFKLIFTCCHPALTLAEQVALTLKSVIALPVEGIARIFLVSKPTMAQRLVRAKRKLREADVQFHVPPADELAERVRAVQNVIYAIFTECYSPSKSSPANRDELCHEGIRLGRLLVRLMEQEGIDTELPESLGLLAMMLLHESRREARHGIEGDLVMLEDQDRSQWDMLMIDEGKAILERGLRINAPGQFLIQAAIIAVHTDAPDYERTDWAQIAALYAELYRMAPTPVVKLNWAVAVTMTKGPQAGLDMLTDIEEEGDLKDYMPFYSTRANFQQRLGQGQAAIQDYQKASTMTVSEGELQHFAQRIREIEAQKEEKEQAP